ncbi:hypothetical protein V495_05613 [Pseudogymnoascus sp. VKM F-4514 (FW-929)]|nr:hypothetical protein V495_05613 [Pseudogymnoascus sp. VKM F-4514 (FW-929)]KFY54998.1 hypothetical protein V497_07281 [Pseudogymnoascus sp. VKM F-4516 (FW-969)]
MPPAPVPAAFEGFARLGPNSYIYEAPKSGDLVRDQVSPPNPDVILFMSWLDAQPKHIAKYTEYYKTLFPNAGIILVTASAKDAVFHTKTNETKFYSPIADTLQALPANTRILLHSFSNGGLSNTALASQEYNRRTGASLPIQAHIFDSSPGYPRFWADIRAIKAGLPKNFLVRTFATALLAVAYAFLKSIWWVKGLENPIIIYSKLVNRHELFSKKVPRAYIYSREDQMVQWTDVENHMATAKGLGYEVRGELFEGTQHVSHMPKDSKRYWGIVQSLWESSFRMQ